jgi:large subunit ribosomal protein L4
MSIELKKYKPDGSEAGVLDVTDSVFSIEPNEHILHLAVRRELANARAGTACAKTRSEVRGGGRKPWKQKGTGRARAGSIRSPLWVGGGVIFGPKPRDYSFDLPKKVRRLALRSSLSVVRDRIRVVEDFSFLTAPQTKPIAAMLKKHGIEGEKVLILADYKLEENKFLQLSVRNLPNVKLSLPLNLSVRDLLGAELIIATQAAVEEISRRFAADV